MVEEIIDETKNLSPEDVQNIRSMAAAGTSRSYLATKYNCDIGHVHYICNRDIEKDRAAWDKLNGKD